MLELKEYVGHKPKEVKEITSLVKDSKTKPTKDKATTKKSK